MVGVPEEADEEVFCWELFFRRVLVLVLQVEAILVGAERWRRGETHVRYHCA